MPAKFTIKFYPFLSPPMAQVGQRRLPAGEIGRRGRQLVQSRHAHRRGGHRDLVPADNIATRHLADVLAP